MRLNPGTPSDPPGGDLLHVSAVGTNDTLHFLFCSLGAPTLLLVHSNTTSSSLRVSPVATAAADWLLATAASDWLLSLR